MSHNPQRVLAVLYKWPDVTLAGIATVLFTLHRVLRDPRA